MLKLTALVCFLLSQFVMKESFALTSIGHRLFSAQFKAEVQYQQEEFSQEVKRKVYTENELEIKIIKNQIKFLTGFLSHLKSKASLINNSQIQVISRDASHIYYQYQGQFLLPESYLDEKSMLAYLPRSVEQLTSLVYKDGAERSVRLDSCTDRHYANDDFWYFFNPHKKNCPLLSAEFINYLLPVDIEISLASEETETTREALSIKKFSQEDKQLDITIFFAPSSDHSSLRIPRHVLNQKSDDLNKSDLIKLNSNLQQYLKLRTILLDKKYQRQKIPFFERFQLLDGDILSGNPMAEDFYKEFGDRSIKVRLITARSSSDLLRYSQFASMWANSLKESDVIVYNGHSGLGGNLSLSNIANAIDLEVDEIQYEQKKFQFVFLNGCATFVHYMSIYQEFRPGQMDLLLNGVSASFSNMGNASHFTIKYFEDLIQSESDVAIEELLEQLPAGQLPVYIPAKIYSN